MNRDLGPWALLLQLGWMIAISIVGSLLIGRWLDQILNTSPWGTLFFILLGIIIGSVAVYRQVARAIDIAAEQQPPKKHYRHYNYDNDDEYSDDSDRDDEDSEKKKEG